MERGSEIVGEGRKEENSFLGFRGEVDNGRERESGLRGRWRGKVR